LNIRIYLGFWGWGDLTQACYQRAVQPCAHRLRQKRDGGFAKSDRIETLSIHAGTRPDGASGARITPIYQTTAFAFDDADHAASLYNLQEPGNIYGRLSNPTTAALEQKLAALDSAVGACCVSSGHAAQLVGLYPLMAPGKKIIASRQLYGGSITQFTQSFKRFG